MGKNQCNKIKINVKRFYKFKNPKLTYAVVLRPEGLSRGGLARPIDVGNGGQLPACTEVVLRLLGVGPRKSAVPRPLPEVGVRSGLVLDLSGLEPE